MLTQDVIEILSSMWERIALVLVAVLIGLGRIANQGGHLADVLHRLRARWSNIRRENLITEIAYLQKRVDELTEYRQARDELIQAHRAWALEAREKHPDLTPAPPLDVVKPPRRQRSAPRAPRTVEP